MEATVAGIEIHTWKERKWVVINHNPYDVDEIQALVAVLALAIDELLEGTC